RLAERYVHRRCNMIKYISVALVSFLIGVGGMYYLASMTLNDLDEKHNKRLKEEYELFRYHNTNAAETLIKVSNASINHTLCKLKGEDKKEVIHALILNAMFASDVSKQSIETLEEVFTTSLLAHKELSRTSPNKANEYLLPLIRNHCSNHLPELNCDKIDSLIDSLSKEPSVCT
ncbi:hypothetical protein ACP43V_11705, partial [Vibrio genomosp. F10 str. 9ZC157]